MLDAEAKAEYTCRLEELREELAEAEGRNDTGRAERARDEIEAIAARFASAVGLGGRKAWVVKDLARARSAVSKRIHQSLSKVREQHPRLGQYLSRTIRTGYFCSYHPDPD